MSNQALALLKQASADLNRNVRDSATFALQRIADGYRQALGPFGDEASVPARRLADIFDAVSPGTRMKICMELPRFREAESVAISVLRRGLTDPEDGVRLCAASGLGVIQDRPKEVIPALVQAMQDASWRVRAQATSSLGKLNHPTADMVAALKQACRDEDAKVRQAATNALNRIQLDLGQLR